MCLCAACALLRSVTAGKLTHARFRQARASGLHVVQCKAPGNPSLHSPMQEDTSQKRMCVCMLWYTCVGKSFRESDEPCWGIDRTSSYSRRAYLVEKSLLAIWLVGEWLGRSIPPLQGRAWHSRPREPQPARVPQRHKAGCPFPSTLQAALASPAGETSLAPHILNPACDSLPESATNGPRKTQ